MSSSIRSMKGSYVRRVVAGLVPLVVLLTAACGGSDSAAPKPTPGTLADITVKGAPGSKPTVTFEAPLSFASTTSKVIDKGRDKGPAVESTSVITADYVAFNASDGARYDSSWTTGKPATFGLDQVIKGIGMGLDGDHAGDRVLIAIASKDGYDPVGNGTTINKGDSLIFVVDLLKVSNPLTKATGTSMSAPDFVPTVVYKKGLPTGFKATKTTPKVPSTLGVYPIIKGKGPVVKKGQTIVVNYLGAIYPDGKVFGESYSTDQTVSKPIGVGEFIPGWDTGLVGQTVGSRIELVVPAAQAYGSQAQGSIPANSNLIFVLDILQAY